MLLTIRAGVFTLLGVTNVRGFVLAATPLPTAAKPRKPPEVAGSQLDPSLLWSSDETPLVSE